MKYITLQQGNHQGLVNHVDICISFLSTSIERSTVIIYILFFKTSKKWDNYMEKNENKYKQSLVKVNISTAPNRIPMEQF